MVDLILGNHPKAFSLGEVSAWFRPYRHHHFHIICSCKDPECPWPELKNVQAHMFHLKCFEILNINVLVDSSKSLPWVIDNNLWASGNKIPVYNLLLFKDPISFFYSFWKRGVSFEKSRKNEYLKYYGRFFQAGLPFVSLNYNKFVAEPAKVLHEICETLDLPYFEGKERFWEKEHHHLFGSMGIRKQVEQGVSEIRSTESYPIEFQKLIPELNKKLSSDKEIQAIYSKLKQNEIAGSSYTNDLFQVRRPYWYFAIRLKQKIAQRFPKRWKYEQ